jgi:NAD(P)-dependent dehydrogenase (short-subunit alcohol dehydrogenase family)
VTLPRTPSFRLDGRRAVVAGASSGIGVGAAVALAEAGAEVTLVARSGPRLDDLAGEMAAVGWAATPLVLDVTDADATAAAIALHGPFDILVNSAGLARHSPALDTTEAEYDTVTDLNVRAAYFLTRAVARGLIAAGRPGSLINVSSQMGRVAGPDRAVYAASKHAIEGFTKAMAIEWGPHGIRVNCVAPTFVNTPLAQQTLTNPDRHAWVMSKIRLGRLAEVEDLMGAFVLLASDAGAMITGTSLLVDGGWTAG